MGTKLPRCARNDGGGVEKAQSIRVLCPEHQQRSFGNYPQRAHSLQAEYSARLLYPPMPKIPLRTITRSAAISILSILCIHVKKSMPKTTDTPLLTPAPLRPLTWIPQGQTNPVSRVRTPETPAKGHGGLPAPSVEIGNIRVNRVQATRPICRNSATVGSRPHSVIVTGTGVDDTAGVTSAPCRRHKPVIASVAWRSRRALRQTQQTPGHGSLALNQRKNALGP